MVPERDCGRRQGRPSRRAFLRTAGILMPTAVLAVGAGREQSVPSSPLESSKPSNVNAGRQASPGDTYETHAKGIRLFPGQWRPHYAWEQIIWVSPPWSSQDYLWLDFPEAIFSSQGLLYLSHVNPKFPAVCADLLKVPWREAANGFAFERVLPNDVRFG